MARKMQILLVVLIRPSPLQIEWLYNPVRLIEAEIWNFEVAHQGYLPVGVDRPVLKQVASGDRAIGIFSTD